MTSAAASTAGRRGQRLVEGEFPLTRDDFRQIADIAYNDAGIDLAESKASLVYSRLAKRLRVLHLESFQSYCSLLLRDEGTAERQEMVAALTTNVTRFFREPHHFEHLKTQVLPALAPATRSGAPVRIWSAACSSGEEPYSIALAILSVIPEAASLNVRVLASDIDPNVLQKGEAGVYSDAAMASIPMDVRKRWFKAVDGRDTKNWRVGEEMRRLVAFRKLNLIGAWPMRGPFHAIFCRNALIYFKEATQVDIWCRFAPLLVPGGRLYIGHSERVFGEAAPLFVNEAITTYRRSEGAQS